VISDKLALEEMDAEFPDLWQRALDQYAATSGKRLEGSDPPKPDTLQGLKAEIEARHTQFSDFRKSQQKLFEALDMALKPIEFICNMAGGVTNQASLFVVGPLGLPRLTSSIDLPCKLLRLRICHVSYRCK
jgi:hypothetical protein